MPAQRERGQWFTRHAGVPVLVTLQPSALLRADPAQCESGYAAWLNDPRLADPHARGDPGQAAR